MMDRRPHPNLALVAICGAVFVAVLDTTVVGLIMPRIGAEFHAGVDGLAWVPNAYILTYALLIATAGVLGDRYGRRRIFALGLVLFGLGSAGCAVAPGLAWLLAARVVQGAGAAAMLTLALALISLTFEDRRQWAIGIYVLVGSGAAALGPLVGGLLASAGGWRLVFVAQVPVSLVGFAFALTTLPESRGISRRTDVIGLLLASTGLLALNSALLEGPGWGWSSPLFLGVGALAATALIAFTWWESRVPEPMLNLAIFSQRRLLAYTIGGFCAWFAVLADVVYPAIYLQADVGVSVGLAGLLVALGAASSPILAPAVNPAVQRFGTDRVLVVSIVALAASVAPWVLASAGWPLWLTVALLGIAGVPLTFVMAVSAAGALSSFAASEAARGAASFNAVRQVGSALGVALPAVALATVLGGRAVAHGSLGLTAGLDAAFAVRLGVIGLCAAGVRVLLATSPSPIAVPVAPQNPA